MSRPSTGFDRRRLRQAAEQGNELGQLNLGFLYATGQGVPKSELQGMSWFRKAAEQGNVQAQFNMGLEYMRMRGSPRTRLSACFWLMLAKAHGVNAAELLGFAQMLENQLSDDERADALAEVRNWKPSSNR